MRSKISSLFFLIIGVNLSSAQWTRWDDTQYCFRKVAENPNLLCCQGTIYSDPSAQLVCCNRKICNIKTGKVVNPSSVALSQVGSRTDPEPTGLPITSVLSGLIFPQSSWVRPISGRRDRTTRRPYSPEASYYQRHQNLYPIIEDSDGDGEEIIRVDHPNVLPLDRATPSPQMSHMGQPETIRVNPADVDPSNMDDPSFYPPGPVDLAPYRQGDRQPHYIPQAMQGGFQDDGYYTDAQPIRVNQANSYADNLPVFLQGPNPLLKQDANYVSSPYEQKQMPASFAL